MKTSIVTKALMVSVLLLATAACGGDDGEDTASTDTGPTDNGAEEAASGDLECEGESINFQLSFFPNAQHVGYLIADARGYYEEEGLSVEVIPGGETVNPPLQLAQGNVEIAQLDFDQMLNTAGSGADVVWVATTYQQSPVRYITLDVGSLSEPGDLEGRSVGTQQQGDLEPELHGMIEQAGLSPEEVPLVPIGFSIEDLLAENIEVFPLRTFFHIAQLEGADISYPDEVDELNPNELDVDVVSQGVAVNGDFMDSSPDAVACFLRASIRGWEAAMAEPEEVLEELQAMMPEGVASIEENEINLREAVALITENDDGETVEALAVDMEKLHESAERLLESGVVEQEVDVDSVVDMGPLEAARGNS